MRIAVITPVFETPPTRLEECVASVRSQTHSGTHFIVCDGDKRFHSGSFPGIELILLPVCHDDGGDTARLIGTTSAFRRGFEAVAFLDPEYRYDPRHLELLVKLQRSTGADVCSGQLHVTAPATADAGTVSVDCLLLTREAFFAMTESLFKVEDPQLSPQCRLFAAIKRANLVHSHLRVPTISCRDATAEPAVTGQISDELTDNSISTQMDEIAQQPDVANERASSTISPSPEPYQGRISLCMVVKNEEANLAACLSPIAKLVHEVIVVDTGSTDQTKEIAATFGAKVIPFVWIDDFAAARNESMRHVRGDWIFWLDADDRINERNLRIMESLFSQLADENTAYFMSVWSAPDDLLGCPFVVDQPRLFRNHASLQWKYRVHEQILPSLMETQPKFQRSEVVIHHVGYSDSVLRVKKRDRNLRLLRMDYDEHPADPYVLFNLGNTLFDEGRWDDAVRFLVRCLENARAEAAYLAKAYVLLMKCKASLGRADEAIRICQEGKKHFPDDSELWFEEATIHLARGDLASARQSFKKVLRVKAKVGSVGCNAHLVHHARHNLAVIYRDQGNIREAEYHWRRVIDDIPGFGPAWLGLTEICLSLQRRDDLKTLHDRLQKMPSGARIIPGIEARIVLKKSSWLQSTQMLEDAIARFPNEVWLRLLLADIFLQVAHDTHAAQQQFQQVLMLDPNQSVAQAKLRSIENEGKPAAGASAIMKESVRQSGT